MIFKKNPTVGLPEASKLIDLVISKGQGGKDTQGNTVFWKEKKYCIKGKMDSL